MNAKAPALALLAVVSACLAARPAAAQDEVTHSTRIEKNQVFVDVENDSKKMITVSSIVVSFYDKKGVLLDKSTITCENDCTVDVDEAEAFGPLEGPKGWDTVNVTKVYYEDVEATAPSAGTKAPKPAPAPAPKAPAPAPAPPAKPATPPAAPAAPAAPPAATAATPEGLMKLFYAHLNRAEYDKAKTLYTKFALDNIVSILGESGFKTWAVAETKNGTVKEVVLTAPVVDAAPMAAIEIRYLDGSKVRRNCQIKKEGAMWKVETVDPL